MAGVPWLSRVLLCTCKYLLIAVLFVTYVLQATMGVRLPTILGKAIDDAVQTLNTVSDEDKIIDLVACVDRMGELMVDLRFVPIAFRHSRARSFAQPKSQA